MNVAGDDKQQEAITVDEMLDRFLKAKEETKEPTTVEWYRRYFGGDGRPVIGKMKLRDLTDAHEAARQTPKQPDQTQSLDWD